MKRTLWTLVVAMVVAAAASPALAVGAVGMTPDQQYRFAEQLAAQGEQEFAVLEFRRFLFLYPRDRRAADAQFAIGRAFLVRGDVVAAERELELLHRQYPRTPAATRGNQLHDLIAANNEFNYQPLLLFFRADAARDGRDYDASLHLLTELTTKYPRSRLAPDAMFLSAQILEQQKKTNEAMAAYGQVVARYPTSDLARRAALAQAKATEARDGAKPHVLHLYQQVVIRYPNTPEATEAQRRVTALRPRAIAIKRQFDQRDARPFKVRRQGYVKRQDRYEIDIEVGRDMSARQLRATLEDALIRHFASRKNPAHAVRVAAYTTRGNRQAGVVDWAPRQQPQYDIEKAEGKDLLRGILEDMLK